MTKLAFIELATFVFVAGRVSPVLELAGSVALYFKKCRYKKTMN
jgi:hypothetical protein